MTTLHGINCCLRDGCLNRIENRTTGLCATHSREARKKSAPKTKARKTRIAKVSDEGKERMAVYGAIRKVFLEARPDCQGHFTRYENDIYNIWIVKATEIHHQRGRVGDLLYDVRYFMQVCRKCHEYIETHPEEAYERGWSLLRTQTEPHKI